ncbi:adhesive plaque matrix protein 2-like [Stegodyphus dumicola]|uniref:adhesive plaque matrix protein 2-like n=1 Tax=Stegodyphus dumicola TaxID=202533 RepID=UPI0015AE5294|nr:adhesive plaque matrix protein 2-like [Stegodyphus dumicola]
MKTGYECSCKCRYSGKQCEEDRCKSNQCYNGGTCDVANGRIACRCKEPYSGNRCEKDPCSSNPCKHDGKCKVTSTGYECFCESPYSGKQCEKDLCELNPCKNGGTCCAVNGIAACNCKEPYSGKLCEKECECINGKCVLNENGRKVCQCPPEYGLSTPTMCEKCNCGKEASCTFDKDKGKTCICKEGYRLVPLGFCTGPCAPNPCENGGTCIDIPDSYKCVCPNRLHWSEM